MRIFCLFVVKKSVLKSRFKVNLILLLHILISGLFVGGVPILARAKFVLTDYVSMSLCVRSLDKEVSELVLSSIA